MSATHPLDPFSAKELTRAVAILRDTGHLVPACAYLQGEYGYKDLYMGVPVKLGRTGLREIIELELTADEKTMLDASAEAVRAGINDVTPFL